jgi:hypothetical protein
VPEGVLAGPSGSGIVGSALSGPPGADDDVALGPHASAAMPAAKMSRTNDATNLRIVAA